MRYGEGRTRTKVCGQMGEGCGFRGAYEREGLGDRDRGRG
jgi:hypothetical protein